MLILDLVGLKCPIPVLKTKKFLANLDSGTTVKIVTTDPASIKDLQDFCRKTGHVLLNQEQVNNEIYTTIKHR